MSDNGENTKYLVRGAVLRCTYGTHPRKLNIPKSHGTFIEDNEKAFATKDDSIGEFDSMTVSEIQGDPKESNTPIEKCNIRMFGICSSPNNPSNDTNVKFASYDNNGNEIAPACGKQCYVKINGKWDKFNKTVFIKDSEAITADSVLLCKFGGVIYVDDPGQDD